MCKVDIFTTCMFDILNCTNDEVMSAFQTTLRNCVCGNKVFQHSSILDEMIFLLTSERHTLYVKTEICDRERDFINACTYWNTGEMFNIRWSSYHSLVTLPLKHGTSVIASKYTSTNTMLA